MKIIMIKSILVILISIFGLAIGPSSGQESMNLNGSQALNLESGMLPKIEIGDEKTYQNLSKLALIQYSEDMTYSAKILKNYVKRNITADEALLSTLAVYILTSKTFDVLQNVQPPRDYEVLHYYILQALVNMSEYFFYLSKYYETNEGIYYNQAKINFNLSADYYDKSIKESKFLF